MTGAPSPAAIADTTEGYISGPDAATEPRRIALESVEHADRVVLVEGVTDQIALDTLAASTGCDLAAHGTVVAPMGGAHAIDTFLGLLADRATPARLSGLCDRREAPVYRAALRRAGLGAVHTDGDLERLGFFVCHVDLEAELIRAVGVERMLTVVDEQGDRASFERLRQQSAWRDRSVDTQFHRFLRVKARRMHRYAGSLVEAAVERGRAPRPLLGALGLL